MRRNKFIFVLLLLLAISAVAFGSTFLYLKLNNEQERNEDELLVMTSCNPIYIATLNVVGDVDGVQVQNLSQPTTGCLHDYTLTTEDMRNLAKADVLVVNGGGMEGYLEDVISAYPNLPIINASEDGTFVGGNVEDQKELEEENSHVWMSTYAYRAEVATIATSLGMIDAEHKDAYVDNATMYMDKIGQTLDSNIATLSEIIDGGNVVLLHEAYEFIASDVGANVVGVMDLDEERQVSAGEVADIIATIKDKDVKIVLAEYDYGHEMGKLITEQTDARVVYLETLIHGSYDADSYIEVMHDNYSKIEDGFVSEHNVE